MFKPKFFIKMTKSLISLLFLIAFVTAQACPEIYAPVCAAKDGHFKTFPNACEANNSNFLIQHNGKCNPKMVLLDACTARCDSRVQRVCGERQGEFKTYVNKCFAKCAGADVLIEGSCSAQRALSIASFFNNLIDKTKALFNKTEKWIEDKSANVSNGAKVVWHKIGDAWENCSCQPFNDVVNWAKKAVNKTEEFVNRTETEVQIIKHNTIQGFEDFKADVQQEWQKLKNATIEAFKRFENRTIDWISKTSKFIKNVTEEAEDWLIEEGQSLKNKTSTWWHKTKEGLESCTCCLVQETKEVLDIIGQKAEQAYQQAKADLIALENKLKVGLIKIEKQGKDAVDRTKDYFLKLWPCVCPRTYDPVCIQTPEGDQATILNQCFADCPKNKLTTVKNGTCESA